MSGSVWIVDDEPLIRAAMVAVLEEVGHTAEGFGDAESLYTRLVAGEVPSSQLSAGELDDPVELLVATALATSKSDARRLLQQGSVRANGTVIAPGQVLDASELLHGRFLLLRKGKRSYHLAEILGAEVDAPGGGG